MKNTYTVPCTYISAVQTSFARFCRVIVVISKSWEQTNQQGKPPVELHPHEEEASGHGDIPAK
jgi:hypothetical protein